MHKEEGWRGSHARKRRGGKDSRACNTFYVPAQSGVYHLSIKRSDSTGGCEPLQSVCSKRRFPSRCRVIYVRTTSFRCRSRVDSSESIHPIVRPNNGHTRQLHADFRFWRLATRLKLTYCIEDYSDTSERTDSELNWSFIFNILSNERLPEKEVSIEDEIYRIMRKLRKDRRIFDERVRRTESFASVVYDLYPLPFFY